MDTETDGRQVPTGRSNAEFFILLTAIDETFSQTVHSRSSYKHDEVVWGAKFADIFQPVDDSTISIDLKKIHDIERVQQGRIDSKAAGLP